MTAQLADRLTGVHTIMPTPFSDDGALDLASLERLTDFLIAWVSTVWWSSGSWVRHLSSRRRNRSR